MHRIRPFATKWTFAAVLGGTLFAAMSLPRLADDVLNLLPFRVTMGRPAPEALRERVPGSSDGFRKLAAPLLPQHRAKVGDIDQWAPRIIHDPNVVSTMMRLPAVTDELHPPTNQTQTQTRQTPTRHTDAPEQNLAGEAKPNGVRGALPDAPRKRTSASTLLAQQARDGASGDTKADASNGPTPPLPSEVFPEPPLDAPDAKAKAPDAELNAPDAERNDEEIAPRTITLNFQDAPWDVVLRRLADEAGFAVQLDVLPPGTFSYSSPGQHTPAQAIDLFNGYLFSSGYLVLRNQKLLTVVKTEAGIPSHLVPLVPPDELEDYGANEFLSIEVPLTSLEPVAAAREVQGLLSPLGRAVPLPSAQRLVVSDFGSNLRNLYRMLWSREGDPFTAPQTVFKLKNAKAPEVAKAINEYFLSQNPSAGGMGNSSRVALASARGAPGEATPPAETVVVAEPDTNSLLVNCSAQQLGRIRDIIEELDCIPPQILIQALLVEVDLGSVDELGVELGVQDSVLFDRSVVDKIVTVTETVSNPGTGIATTNQRIISQTADPGFNFNNRALGNNTSASPSVVGTQGLSNFAVGRINGDLGYGGLVLSAGSESVSALLRALSARRKVDILSRPQVRTLENQAAEIQIGQQVPVVDGVSLTPVGSANPVIRQDQAGIILNVLPRVSPFDEVVIDVTAEKSEFRTTPGSGIPIFTDATNGNVIEAPIKDVSRAKTTVSCMAGQTIILGGMITKGTSVVERKVPWLGDIPIVGWLFRYDLEESNRKELLIFLTPYIVRNPISSDEHTQREMDRMHFPEADAAQMHGPNPQPPQSIEPPGVKRRGWPLFGRSDEETVVEDIPVTTSDPPPDASPSTSEVLPPPSATDDILDPPATTADR